MYISKNIRYLRKLNNLSQEDLASRFGYKSYTTIQKWESGDSEPPIGVVNELAQFFRINIDDFVKIDLEQPAASEQSSLSADELKLLNTYRSFNSTGKAKLMDYVADLESSPRNYGEVLDSCTGSTAKDDKKSSGGCA